MSDWSLARILADLHQDIERRLASARATLGHSVAKGSASERVWLELLQTYLLKYYQVQGAFVVDSEGAFSEQIDVVIFDRQYSPFIFKFEGEVVIPAESVYAVFEAKQAINASQVEYAQKKIATVRQTSSDHLADPACRRCLSTEAIAAHHRRTSDVRKRLDPGIGKITHRCPGVGPGKTARPRLCGSCTVRSVADLRGCYLITPGGKPATAFLLELIARLQASATVPMIDVRAYAKWLAA